MKGKAVIALMLLALASYSAQANSKIKDGVRSGELTVREARYLIGLQNNVQRIKRNALLDGVITRKERKRIARAEKKLRRQVHIQTHDRQRVSGSRVIG